MKVLSWKVPRGGVGHVCLIMTIYIYIGDILGKEQVIYIHLENHLNLSINFI